MQERIFRGGLCLLPLVVFVTSCASYILQTGDVVADVYLQTLPYDSTNAPITPSILAFRAGPDGNLSQAQTLKPAGLLMTGHGSMVFTADYYPSQAIHQYAIAQDGSLTGPVSTLYPANYDTTGCGAPTGHGMLDPTGTYLTVELEDYAKGCDVWQTYRLHGDGTYEFRGEDNSNLWYWRDGGVDMGFPGLSAMSTDGQYAYAEGAASGGSFLVAMKRDASEVLRIWDSPDWPWDTQYRYQPGGPLTDGNNHVVMLMRGNTNTNWTQTWLASFSIDPATGNLLAITTYDIMPNTGISEVAGIAFSPRGDIIAMGSFDDGTLRTFHYHTDGPATPSASSQLPKGQYIQQMAWDTSHHLYVLTQTLGEQPFMAQFSLYVFTAEDGQLEPAPGSPWNVPNASVLLVVPRG